ncbi:substrate-binding domain-containing protein [Streptomyces sp. NBC_00893]|uniref:substrate-binding domain-containing protein n=1 Tax=Streptomyces sp. NBC_00893 TaxID=2975862 RepID=UPI0022566DAD|nr:substrate-binding domain-containing protein [Streptomyces sp. NBC_00893]MCX4843781.1 substrate-binding domain-containing protein [Streptomyces sp. NBC_00893]
MRTERGGAARAHAAPFRVLVHSEVTGFGHDSIPAGIDAIEKLGAENGFEVEATEDSTVFHDTYLALFQAVVFNNANSTPENGVRRGRGPSVAPDRRGFFARRTGKLKVIDQRTMKVSTALDLAYTPEMTSQTDGLLGVALDPGFASDNRLYLLHSDKTGKQLNLSRPTCGFAVTDVMAVGALAALREAGPRVPEDVPPAGFDDIPLVRELSPAPTTVALPLTAMGEDVIAPALRERSAGWRARVVRVAGELVVRESTATPPVV